MHVKFRLTAITGSVIAGLMLVGVAFAASPSPSADAFAEPAASQEAVSSAPSAAAPATSEPSQGAATVEPSTAPTKEAASSEPAKTLDESPDVEPATTTLTGVLKTVTDADGDTEYVIGTTRVSVGPPWFWGTKHPLAGLVGDTVTVTGHMDDGAGPANDKAKNTDKVRVPKFEVYTVNGKTVREPGKPAWAGGPKVVGSSHPGYAGSSKNHPKTSTTP